MADAYQLYLKRFAERVGTVEVGGYGKWNGKLIKKLDPAEFEKVWSDFVELKTNYDKSFEMNMTVDNLIMKLLRERAAQLVMDDPT